MLTLTTETDRNLPEMLHLVKS